jgi:iron(III) transport system permease protein
MRLATPAFLAIALLSMVRALEAFEVPILVGEPGGINILTTEVYLDLEKKVPPDLGQASAFSIALLILTAGLIFSYSRLSRNASRYQTVTGKGFRPRTIDLGRARYLSLALLILNLTFTLLLPMAGLLWLSLMPFSQTISLRGLQLATTRNYATVIRSSDYLDLAWTTFRMAAGGATLAMALTMLCAWLAVRRRRFAWLLDQLAAIPLAFPGIVLGIALLQMFLSLPIHIYGTIAAFVVAFTIRFLPYGMRYAQSGIIQIHSELEEAAGVGGASLLTVFLRIVVPLCWPTIMAGWLFTFLLGARDLSMSILLASPSVQPVAVAMFDLWSNGQGPELAAFGLVWTAIMTIVASLMYFASRRTAL